MNLIAVTVKRLPGLHSNQPEKRNETSFFNNISARRALSNNDVTNTDQPAVREVSGGLDSSEMKDIRYVTRKLKIAVRLGKYLVSSSQDFSDI